MLTVSASAAPIAPIAPGSYPAYCYGLIDLGEQFNEKFSKWSRKVLIMWEIADQDQYIDIGGEMSPRSISQKYTMSLNERSALYRDLTAWRGREFTPEELKSFDLRNIVGSPCMLNIQHREYNGNTFASIGGIMKLPRNLQPDPPKLETIVFDLDTDDLKMLEIMPEWVEKQIKESKTYKDRTGANPPADIADLDIPVEDDLDEVPF